jgi:hypothetical protein
VRFLIDLKNTEALIIKSTDYSTKKYTLSWYTKINSIFKQNNNNTTTTLYLRSGRQFNKGRYSRNRQLYRTGVYWCIWLNVFIVYGLYFYFYRFTFSFGYLWLPIGFMILTFFASRGFKYRLYTPVAIMSEFIKFSTFVNMLFTKSIFFFRHYAYNAALKNLRSYKGHLLFIRLLVTSRLRRIKKFFIRVLFKK